MQINAFFLQKVIQITMSIRLVYKNYNNNFSKNSRTSFQSGVQKRKPSPSKGKSATVPKLRTETNRTFMEWNFNAFRRETSVFYDFDSTHTEFVRFPQINIANDRMPTHVWASRFQMRQVTWFRSLKCITIHACMGNVYLVGMNRIIEGFQVRSDYCAGRRGLFYKKGQ